MGTELKKRLNKLHHLSGKLGSVLIFNLESSPDPNFFYFTNSDVNGIFYYDFSKPKIFTSAMEQERAKKSWIKDIETAKLEQPLKELPGRTGINKKRLSVEIFERLRRVKTVDVSGSLEGARIIKSAYEIKQIKTACRLSKKIYSKAEKEISEKITEHGLKGIIELLVNKQGCEPSFPTIVAAGKNSRFPHHKPAKTKLKEPVVIDFGVRFNGYCSDMARTVGSRSEEMLENLIEDIESVIAANKKAGDIENFAREKLGKEEKFFIHSLGHGIGIEVHERPSISNSSKDVLKPGMTFTIEPGLYSKEGIRIENDYLLTEKKLVCLTK